MEFYLLGYKKESQFLYFVRFWLVKSFVWGCNFKGGWGFFCGGGGVVCKDIV